MRAGITAMAVKPSQSCIWSSWVSGEGCISCVASFVNKVIVFLGGDCLSGCGRRMTAVQMTTKMSYNVCLAQRDIFDSCTMESSPH